MKPKTTEQWIAEAEKAQRDIERLQSERDREQRVIALLVAAGLVSEEKVDTARELLSGLK